MTGLTRWFNRTLLSLWDDPIGATKLRRAMGKEPTRHPGSKKPRSSNLEFRAQRKRQRQARKIQRRAA